MSQPNGGWKSPEEFKEAANEFVDRVKATLDGFTVSQPETSVPEPQPEPTPDPVPVPNPEPEPAPEPEPTPNPEPQPGIIPNPQPEQPAVDSVIAEYPIWPEADRKPAPQIPGYDEDEPQNWHLVHSTEKATPANPLGPTWTRYTGKRFSSNWGLPTFEWSGHKWFQHIRPDNARPQAPNPRTGKRSFIGGGRVQPDGTLLLRSEGINGGAEVVLVDSTGYGVYEFEYGASFDKMHYSAVLGLFSYSWNEFNHGGGYAEIDFIEISQWNNPPAFGPQYGSVSYYHDNITGNPVGQQIVPSKFKVPAGYQRLTTRVEWRKNYLRVTTKTEDGKVLGDFETRDRVPRDNDQQIRLQLWTCEQEDKSSPYQDWVNAWPDEVVFYRFDYKPEPAKQEENLPAVEAPVAPAAPSPEEETVAPLPQASANQKPEVLSYNGKKTYVAQTGRRFESDYGCDTFEWKGFEWGIREVNDILPFDGPQAPPPGERRGAWVKGAHVYPDGNLLLENAGIYGGVEIFTKKSLGYGTYEFEFTADFDAMHAASVFGIFPYDFAEHAFKLGKQVDYERAASFTEIDFTEFSRWGDLRQDFVKGETTYYDDRVQEKPYQIGKHYVDRGQQRIRLVAVWKPDFLSVKVTDAAGNVLSDASTTQAVPEDNTQQLHINLWVTTNNATLVNGQPSYHGATKGEVVILNDFKFKPLFPGDI